MDEKLERAVFVEGLHKNYRKLTSKESVEALKGISLKINKGELFGIIGPDGAGKTTLFRILTSLLLPSSGEAKVLGLDVVKEFRALREEIGYMPERFSLYGDLTVDENLNFFASIFDTTIKENYHLVEEIFKDIAPFGKRRAKDLSGGMKQKLALSSALIHKPKILFLDEPTTGVDPISRREFWQILKKLKGEGITIVVSTSYMEEALLCDRIALFKEGRVMSCDTPSNMIASFKKRLLAVRGEQMAPLLYGLREIPSVLTAYSFGAEHHITVEIEQESSLEQQIKELTLELREQLKKSDGGREEERIEFEIESIEPTIEDCYLELSSAQ